MKKSIAFLFAVMVAALSIPRAQAQTGYYLPGLTQAKFSNKTDLYSVYLEDVMNSPNTQRALGAIMADVYVPTDDASAWTGGYNELNDTYTY